TTGYLLLLGIAIFAFAGYSLARMSYAHRTGASQTIATARAAALDERIGEVSSEVRSRLAAMSKAAYRRLRSQGGSRSDQEPVPDRPDPSLPADDVIDDRDTAEHPAVDHADPAAAFEVDATRASGVDETAASGVDETAVSGIDATVAFEDDTVDFAPGADDSSDARGGRDYLEDLDPEVSNPFPWSPEDPTRPD